METYPEVLRQHIVLLPSWARSAEWFNTLPLPIQRQFWKTAKNFPRRVLAEYLRDNHGSKMPEPEIKSFMGDDEDYRESGRVEAGASGDDNNRLDKRLYVRNSDRGYDRILGTLSSNNRVDFHFPDGIYAHKGCRVDPKSLHYVGYFRSPSGWHVRASSCPTLENRLRSWRNKIIASGIPGHKVSEVKVFEVKLEVSEFVRGAA